MLKLFSAKEKLKQQQNEQQQSQEKSSQALDGQMSTKVKPSIGELRLQKELSDFCLPDNMEIDFVETKQNLMHFHIIIKPEEGIYREGRYVFNFQVPHAYPHNAPKVLCLTKIFHPNIDLNGAVCLNILREDWSPVLSISSIIFGLHLLFLEPNTTDPLHQEAATLLSQHPKEFETAIQAGIHQGIKIYGNYFPPCVK